jgi:hypothetical protein
MVVTVWQRGLAKLETIRFCRATSKLAITDPWAPRDAEDEVDLAHRWANLQSCRSADPSLSLVDLSFLIFLLLRFRPTFPTLARLSGRWRIWRVGRATDPGFTPSHARAHGTVSKWLASPAGFRKAAVSLHVVGDARARRRETTINGTVLLI